MALFADQSRACERPNPLAGHSGCLPFSSDASADAHPLGRHPRRAGLDPGHPGQPLAGRRHRGREGDPGQGQRHRAPLLRRDGVLRRPQPPAGRCPHVPLRGGRRRGDQRGRPQRGPLPCRDPRRPHRRAGPREPERPALRGLGRRPIPGDGPRPRLRRADAGDLHPLRHRRLLRARHPHPDRRPGAGHDRLPLRPGDGRRRRPRAPRRARLRPRAGLRDPRGRPDRHPQPAWHRHPLGRLSRGLRGRHRRPRAAAASSSSR